MHEKHWREKIALQAARLMCDATVIGYEEARQEAIRVLGYRQVPAWQLPTKQEIRTKVALLAQGQQRDLRRRLLEELVVTMRALHAFNPRIDAESLDSALRPESQFEIEVDPTPVESIVRALPKTATVPNTETPSDGLQTSGDVCIYLRGEFFLNVRIARSAVVSRCDGSTLPIGITELERELDGYVERSGVVAAAAPSLVSDRFAHYAALLLPLEQVVLSLERHPEGDALYHSLQVFQRALDERPYDEEFLLAALLHDVGKAIDPQNHVVAGLAALADHVSERTARLIEQHHQGHHYLDYTLGMRARRRLEADPNFEELLLLAECDKKGRERGVPVPDIDQALEQIRSISEAFSD